MSDRSRLASYNRMRAKMLAHAFDADHDVVAGGADQAEGATGANR